jgi:Protein of Unknown function (DUF2784)
MTPEGHLLAADAVLIAHLAVINFNLFGLFTVPLGGWLGWRFVRVAWWRWLHLASMAIVAVQAAAGRACFLTIIQDNLAGASTAQPPLIVRVVDRLVYWPVPLWAFAVIYLALLAYVIALFWLVPVRPTRSAKAAA